MDFRSQLCFFLVFFASILLFSSHAYEFQVGGRQGWVLHPSENYNHWAARNRFQINDTLYFKYKKGSDSVLLVKKDDYYKCNTKNAVTEMKDGNSVFKFEHSGPFYFVSGKEDSCKKGHKLIIVVMADRTQKYPTPPKAHPPSASAPKPHLGPSASPPKPHSGPKASPPKSHSGPSASPPKSHLGPSASPISPTGAPIPSAMSPHHHRRLSPSPVPAMSPESHKSPSPFANPPKSQSPKSESPVGNPPQHSISPYISPSSPVPSGSPHISPMPPVSSPNLSPSPASVLPKPPSPSPTESSQVPAVSPQLPPKSNSPAPAPAKSYGPANSPKSSPPGPQTTPPAASTPSPSSTESGTPAPSSTESGTPANINSPSPAAIIKSSANALVGLSITLVLSLALGSFVGSI